MQKGSWSCQLLKSFSRNSNLDDSGISFPAYPSRINLKRHIISVIPKLVKKVLTNLDLSKASGPDCVLPVVLRNWELELSYILAELFNMCLKEPCFLVETYHLLFLLRMLGRGLTLKTTTLLVFSLWLVKSSKNL